MRFKNKSKILFSLVCVLFFLGVFFMVSAQERKLEVSYPPVPGTTTPNTTATALAQYIYYFFQFLIRAIGVIAVFFTVIAGIIYLTSAGEPEKLKKAKGYISSTLWGVLILLASYLLLLYINPQFLVLPQSGGGSVPPPPPPVSNSLQIYNATSDLLGRIGLLAKEIKENFLPTVSDQVKKIPDLTSSCDCANTKSTCSCDGANISSSCIGRIAAEGNDGQNANPCKEKSADIHSAQKSISDYRDRLLYYKNRVITEKTELDQNITNFLNPQNQWLATKIDSLTKLRDQFSQGNAFWKSTDSQIKFWTNENNWIQTQIQYKGDTKNLLDKLATTIDPLSDAANSPFTQLTQKMSMCFSNVPTQCKPQCQGMGGGSGGQTSNVCRDYLQGCQPATPQGGNPCPQDISQVTNTIDSQIQTIQSAAQAVIDEVNNIKQNYETRQQIIL